MSMIILDLLKQFWYNLIMRTGYSLGIVLCFFLGGCTDPQRAEPIPSVISTEKDHDPKLPLIAEKQLKEEKQEETYIHIGSFQGDYFYEEMLARLEADGYKSVITAQKVAGSKKRKTIKLGPFPKKQAEIIKAILLDKNYPQDMYLKK